MAETLAPHRVIAHNAATESENRIHADDVARSYGFRGGLVPGVAVYAYMTYPAAERWGLDWLEQGTMRARFERPVYEGEEITIDAVERHDAGDPFVSMRVVGPDGSVRATGHALLPAIPPSTRNFAPYAIGSLPERRPPAGPESLAPGTVLGTVDVGFRTEHARGWLAEHGDDLAVYRDEAVAHPGWLVLGANTILVANVELGPWIHVESIVTHLGVARDGDRVATRGRVCDRYERKGHQFVELDLQLVANGERPLQHVHHVAIYEPRPPS